MEKERRGFQKEHRFYPGGENGWFKKGQIPHNKGKRKNYKKNKCMFCSKEMLKGKTENINSYNKRKYCSHKCWSETKKKLPEKKNCLICSGFFLTKNKKKKFCSNFCRYNRPQKSIKGLIRCSLCKKELFKFPSTIKVSKEHFCSRKCMANYRKSLGIKPPSRKGSKWSQTQRELRSKTMMGKNNHNWKGGVGRWRKKSLRWKTWREKVFERDDYTCQHCKIRGGRLEAHHVKSWKDYPKLRFILDNGLTLCRACHKKTDSWGRQKNTKTK